jgi:hypothetical protein
MRQFLYGFSLHCSSQIFSKILHGKFYLRMEELLCFEGDRQIFEAIILFVFKF